MVPALLLAASTTLPVTLQGQDVQRAQAAMNVRLTFQIIGADQSAGGAGTRVRVRDMAAAQRDEAEIQAVVSELRKLFRFEDYRLLATSILNATAVPRSNVRQRLVDADGRQFEITAEVTQWESGIRLAVELTGSTGTLINASVNLENGKTVVLGTANAPGPGPDWRLRPGTRDTARGGGGGRGGAAQGGAAPSARGAAAAGSPTSAVILVVTPTINP
jgi:hypothetical protein